MAYDPSSFNYADDQMQYTVDHSQFESQRTRPSAPSTSRCGDVEHPRFLGQPRQPPISEAVSSAFDKADIVDYVHPELIAQITENVIKQLKTSGIESANPVSQSNKPFLPPPPPPIHQPVPLSPSTVSGSPPPMHARNLYTPPSPHRHTDYPRHESPDLPPRNQSPPPQNTDRRGSSPISQSGESGYTRPKGPARLSTGREETTLEKIWGQLFDEESNPTPRLGQVLRGLAVHIIEDYEPCNSIVITPRKMIKFYEDVKLQNETYPWHAIFDEKSSISRMYRELCCQHHLVQERDDEKPSIPGLTPVGFERWVTLLIKAHPDEEYERLQKAVLAMPISNPDEKKERFPKEISRRLFPSTGDRKVCQRLDDAISEHANVDLPKRIKREASPIYTTSVAAEPAHAPPTHRREPGISVETKLTSNFQPSPLERERAPYSNTPLESADDTKSFPPPSQPIERERKPYTAVPGVGKAFEDERAGKPRSESISANIGRSNSIAKPRAAPLGGNASRPMEIPKTEVHNPNRANSNARRQRSPSFSRGSDGFRRSESDVRGYPPPFPASSAPHVEVFDDDHRRYARERTERSRRQADEDARAYGESPNARARYERGSDVNGPYKGSYVNADEEYYRNSGRGGTGGGYEYPQQPYGGSVYRS